MDEAIPKVTPAMLRRAERMCARRLRCGHHDQRGNRPAAARFRVVDQLYEDARLVHLDLAAPSPAGFRALPELEPEGRQVYEAAARWYVALFGNRAVRAVDVDEWETDVDDIGIRLVGRAGLAVEDAHTRAEVRVLRVGGPAVPPSPVDAVDARFALLRRTQWARGRTLHLYVADLLHGDMSEARVSAAELDDLREWLAERVAVIRDRVAHPAPHPGLECGTCRYVAGCQPHA